ncbi:MAG: prohibitin family protein [Anaerolineae bacterium]|nr:prohibitin family protein [Anaerolineae bacterium]
MIILVLNVLAIAGLAIAGFGVFMIAQAVSRNDPTRAGITLTVIGVVIAAVFFMLGSGVVEIQPQEVGVVFNVLSGELSDTPLGPGLHIIIPGIQQVTIYSTAQQEYTVAGLLTEGAARGDEAVVALTQDGQEVSLDVTMLFSIDPAKANIIHRRWQDRYISGLIRPTLRSEARASLTEFRVEEIYGGDRTQLVQSIEGSIRSLIEPEGFQLTNILIRHIRFSPEYVASIERKQVAQQEALEAEFRVQQRRQEAEQVRELARGDADAAVTRATGEAEALRLINEQLVQNPLLLQWRYVEKLSDDIQIIVIPSNSPFLFDLESLIAAKSASGTSPSPVPTVEPEPATGGD